MLLGVSQERDPAADANDNYGALPVRHARPAPTPGINMDIVVDDPQGTLAVATDDPLGLYLVDWDDTGWTKPDGTPGRRLLAGGPRGARCRAAGRVRGAGRGGVRGGRHPDRRTADRATAARSPSTSRWRPHGRRGNRAMTSRGAAGAGGARRPTADCSRRSRSTCRRQARRRCRPLPAAAVQPTVGAAEPASRSTTARRADDIQGNMRPRLQQGPPALPVPRRSATGSGARRWLRWLAPAARDAWTRCSTFRDARSGAERLRPGAREPRADGDLGQRSPSRTPGCARSLGERGRRRFGDQSFRQGLAERSTYLGDPTDSARPGPPRPLGGRRTRVRRRTPWSIVAADSARRSGDDGRRGGRGRPPRTASRWSFEQRGRHAARRRCAGHEHFGFKDGVSQPGVRGSVSAAAGDFDHPALPATRRRPARARCSPSPASRWSGRGSSCSASRGRTRSTPSTPAASGRELPELGARAARTSSAGGCARTSPAFWDFVAARRGAAAARRRCTSPRMLVGRWPSGAPLIPRAGRRRPRAGRRRVRQQPLPLRRRHPSAVLRRRSPRLRRRHPSAGPRRRASARVCPHFAHIRKVNPRDSGTDFGHGRRHAAAADAAPRHPVRRAARRRRGPVAGAGRGRARADVPLPTCASIEDQFEFVTRRWANSPVQPEPRRARPGHRPARQPAATARRIVDVPSPDGGSTTLAAGPRLRASRPAAATSSRPRSLRWPASSAPRREVVQPRSALEVRQRPAPLHLSRALHRRGHAVGRVRAE